MILRELKGVAASLSYETISDMLYIEHAENKIPVKHLAKKWGFDQRTLLRLYDVMGIHRWGGKKYVKQKSLRIIPRSVK